MAAPKGDCLYFCSSHLLTEMPSSMTGFCSVDQSMGCAEMIPQQANLVVQVPHFQRRQNECMEEKNMNAAASHKHKAGSFTRTHFFFFSLWLCFLNPLPGRSARPSMPTGFLSCDIYFFSLLFLFSFFPVRLSSCADADGPRAAHLAVITLSVST